MTCPNDETSTCPFASTEHSEMAQAYSCLPTPFDIRVMRVVHGKTWACHDEPTKPCVGAIRDLRQRGEPHQVIDPVLLTEMSDWGAFTRPVGPEKP